MNISDLDPTLQVIGYVIMCIITFFAIVYLLVRTNKKNNKDFVDEEIILQSLLIGIPGAILWPFVMMLGLGHVTLRCFIKIIKLFITKVLKTKIDGPEQYH